MSTAATVLALTGAAPAPAAGAAPCPVTHPGQDRTGSGLAGHASPNLPG